MRKYYLFAGILNAIVLASLSSCISTNGALEEAPMLVGKATAQEEAALTQFQKNVDEVDHVYPAPRIPADAKPKVVIRVSENGDFTTADWHSYSLAGLICSSTVRRYFKSFGHVKPLKIVIAKATSKEKRIQASYIWSVEEWKAGKNGTDAFKASSLLNDLAALNHWCYPDQESEDSIVFRMRELRKIRAPDMSEIGRNNFVMDRKKSVSISIERSNHPPAFQECCIPRTQPRPVAHYVRQWLGRIMDARRADRQLLGRPVLAC